MSTRSFHPFTSSWLSLLRRKYCFLSLGWRDIMMSNTHNNPSGHRRGREELRNWRAPIDSASPNQNLSQTWAQSDEHLPIHEQKLQVNLQTVCPLYNGRIPPEIRDAIFFYCLLEQAKTDEPSQYPRNTKYNRPGYTSKRKMDIALLQTCRRVYLETYHLPAVNREHVFWHAPPTAPPHQNHYGNRRQGFIAELQYFKQFQPWQLKLVKEIHLFTQMYWLEDTFTTYCHQYFMQGLERVKLTIRRSDWWWNERNAPLCISPQRNDGQNVAKMLQDIATEQRGGELTWVSSAWGSAFKYLKALKELEIEFETSEDKKGELEAILKWAKTWRFPLNDGMVLSTEGLDVTSTSWQTPMCYWSDHCPHCGTLGRCRLTQPSNSSCAERMKMKQFGWGPTCYIYSMRWKVARDANPSDG